MAIALNLTDIQSGFLTATAYTQNNTLIEQALQDAINRQGGVNNEMLADLDMGLNNIINVNNIDVNTVTQDGTDYTAVLSAFADAAALSASNAAASETAAASSATDANQSYLDTKALSDQFRGTYYGSFTSDPTQDPLGNPIEEGDLYYNTVDSALKVYDGVAAWNNVNEADAVDVIYNNTASGLTATDVQAAIDESAEAINQNTSDINQRTIYAGSVAELEAITGTVTGQAALVRGSLFRWGGAEWVPENYVTVEAFGADPDEPDNTTALRQAISSGYPLDWGGETYDVTDDIGNGFAYTSRATWKGNGASVRLTGASHRQALCSISAGPGIDVVMAGVTFDCNRLSNQGLVITSSQTNDIDDLPSAYLSKVRAKRAYRKDGVFQGGEGILVRGGFKTVLFNDGTGAEDCALADGAGTPGTVGIAGATITHFGLDGWPENVILDGVAFRKIYSEDPTYEADQDGVKVFAPHTSSLGVPVKSFLTVLGGSSFENCYGRSIKSQMFFNRINECTFIRNEGFTSGVGNDEIATQVSGAVIGGIDCFYSNGQTPQSIVTFSGNASGATPYQIGSHKVSGIRCYLDGLTTLRSAVLTFPNGGKLGPVTVDDVSVFGECREILEYLINDDTENNSATVTNCFAQEFTPDGTTGNRCAVRVRSSGGTGFPVGKVFMRGNVYGGVNDAFLIEGRVGGTLANVDPSGYGNYGFVSDNTARPSDEEPSRQVALAVDGLTGSGRDQRNVARMFSEAIAAGATATIDVGLGAGLVFFNTNRDREDAALFNATNQSGGRIAVIYSGANVAIGDIANPGTGDFNIWVSGTNQLSIENNDPSTRIVSLYVMSVS